MYSERGRYVINLCYMCLCMYTVKSHLSNICGTKGTLDKPKVRIKEAITGFRISEGPLYTCVLKKYIV